MKKNKLAVLGLGVLSIVTYSFALDLLPEKPPVPSDNPITPAKVALGKALYFDPRLSSTNKVSCSSCHDPRGAGTDSGSVSVGINGLKGGRRAPSVWNAAYHSVQFWDGRAPTLEEQAKGPMINPIEMGMKNHDEVVKKIAAIPGYAPLFEKAFGDQGPITIDRVAKAIATYERTLVTHDSPYDLYVKGNKSAMSPAAVRGMKLTQSIGCVACHGGPNFSGPTLPVGQGFFMKFPTIPGTDYDKKYHFSKDLGRYEVTHNESDKNFWRVPSWRNVAIRAPYFHNGAVKTLDEAVRVMAKTQLNRDLTDQEAGDLVEFLKSLTGKRADEKAPELPM